MPKNKFLTAIEEGDLQTVKTLLFDSDNNKFDMEGALITAADYGHIEIVRFLIQNNTDINHINSTKDTALTLAAEQGHTEIVNLLITNGAKVNHKTKFGNTALTKAAKNGHLNVVDLLIANDADINQINLRGETALIRAQKQKHTKVEKNLTKQCSLESNKNEINATNYNNKPSINVTVFFVLKEQ